MNVNIPVITRLSILQPTGQEVLPDAETLNCVPTFDFVFSLWTCFAFPSCFYTRITAVVEIWRKKRRKDVISELKWNVLLPTKSRHPQETLDVVLIVKLSKKLWEENHQVQFRNHPSCSVARDKNFVLCLLGPTNINDKLTVGWYHQQIFFQRFSFPEYFANYVIQIMLHQKTLIRGSISNIKCGFMNE